MKSHDLLISPSHSDDGISVAKTRAGFVFNPTQNAWVIEDGVYKFKFNFDIDPSIPERFIESWKRVDCFYLLNFSGSHAQNMHNRMLALVRHLLEEKIWIGEDISQSHLASYYSNPTVREMGYLSSLAGFLKEWKKLGYTGVSDSAIKFLNSVRLRGNKKGEAILTMDPFEGPLSLIEYENLIDALADAYGNQRISKRSYLLVWLFAALGMRPVQYAALKVRDFRKVIDKEEVSYVLSVPRAKQQGSKNARSFAKDRVIVAEVGALLDLHILDLKGEFLGDFHDLGDVPIFPNRKNASKDQLSGFRFHSTSKQLGQELQEVCARLNIFSERTGQTLEIGARRLRRTVGTRAAEEGFGVMVIAELLDHSDTQNAGVYVESTPAIAQRIDRAVAMHLAPLAHAFSGKIINDESQATRGSDKSSRIVDLRIDQSGSAMGSCGQHSFCGFSAPIACYTCSCFEPWLDGPHEAVLHHLIEKRERLLETTDERIASINDRTILAVAEVVQLCAQMKTKKLGA